MGRTILWKGVLDSNTLLYTWKELYQHGVCSVKRRGYDLIYRGTKWFRSVYMRFVNLTMCVLKQFLFIDEHRLQPTLVSRFCDG